MGQERQKDLQIRTASPCAYPCWGEYSINNSIITEDAVPLETLWQLDWISLCGSGHQYQIILAIWKFVTHYLTTRFLSLVSLLVRGQFRHRCRMRATPRGSLRPGFEGQLCWCWGPSCCTEGSTRACAGLAALNDKHWLSIAFWTRPSR